MWFVIGLIAGLIVGLFSASLAGASKRGAFLDEIAKLRDENRRQGEEIARLREEKGIQARRIAELKNMLANKNKGEFEEVAV